jgi:hypothetical protein
LTPTDDDFDDMHHALGRPDGPHIKPYRNRYCVGLETDTARRFQALGCWSLDCTINGGRDGLFSVNDAGRLALFRWLAAKQKHAGVRCWSVHTRGGHISSVVAKTRSAARYAAFLKICDLWPDGYGEWLTKAAPRVRVA